MLLFFLPMLCYTVLRVKERPGSDWLLTLADLTDSAVDCLHAWWIDLLPVRMAAGAWALLYGCRVDRVLWFTGSRSLSRHLQHLAGCCCVATERGESLTTGWGSSACRETKGKQEKENATSWMIWRQKGEGRGGGGNGSNILKSEAEYVYQWGNQKRWWRQWGEELI